MAPEPPDELEQGELVFSRTPTGPDGYEIWQEQRRAVMLQAARTLGLPLGREVEVELRDGARMKGVLQLAEDGLFIEVSREKPPLLRIGKCTFQPREIVSCARVD